MGESQLGYCLALGDGSNWHISSDKEMAPFVSKFAKISRLRECKPSYSSEIAFSKYKPEMTDANSLKKISEWNLYKYRYIHIWLQKNFEKAFCEIKESSEITVQYLSMWFSLQPIYQKSISLGGLPLHAGLAELDGKAILFAAPGGTGKSTCCRRLPGHWKALCDDEVLIVMDKNGRYLAHPFPTWSDYIWQRAENTWDIQYSVPLSAIFFIEQSSNDEVIPMKISHSSMNVMGSSLQVLEKYERTMSDEEKITSRKEAFSNAYEIAKNASCYSLCATLNGRFWEEIEKVIV
jgi:SynChlorMet cassette protein ScmC